MCACVFSSLKEARGRNPGMDQKDSAAVGAPEQTAQRQSTVFPSSPPSLLLLSLSLSHTSTLSLLMISFFLQAALLTRYGRPFPQRFLSLLSLTFSRVPLALSFRPFRLEVASRVLAGRFIYHSALPTIPLTGLPSFSQFPRGSLSFHPGTKVQD